MFKRISSDWEHIGTGYQVVVIGSGYGAGVAASRLSRAGMEVCVLERGKEFLPGEFPNSIATAKDQFRIDTNAQTIGASDGLYNLHVHDDMMAVVGCGLGGTSLINANVALEMHPELFSATDSRWPQAYRADPKLLAPFAERAKKMLGVNEFPDDLPSPNKLKALEVAARKMKQPFAKVPIAVNFKDQTNPQGVQQPKCNMCGDCTSGCNVGAKNTTQMNYLPDAVNYGAHIFTGALVDRIEKGTDRRWTVVVRENTQAHGSGTGPEKRIDADFVMVGAGAIGSTEILLRSSKGLGFSAQLGQHFSGNGDVLGVAYDCNWDEKNTDGSAPTNINGIGMGTRTVDESERPGPCITGVIDMRSASNPLQRMVIEEGVIPGALAMALPPALFYASSQLNNTFQFGTEDGKRRLLAAQAIGETLQSDVGSLSDLAYKGPTARTQTFLIMSLDEAQGAISLNEHNRAVLAWPGEGSSPVIAEDNRMLAMASEALQGQYISNPVWDKAMGRKLVTVHPLGGCCMGDDATLGVVNHKCQVFSGTSGSEVYEGLYVCDGSVIPGAVGVNPLLTISAVAERACELLVQDQKAAGLPVSAAPSGKLAPRKGADLDARDPQHLDATGLETAVVSHLESASPDGEHSGLKGLWSNVYQHIKSGAVDFLQPAFDEVLKQYPEHLSPSLGFSETMSGWISVNLAHVPDPQSSDQSYQIAQAWGRSAGEFNALALHLDVLAQDAHVFVESDEHRADISGNVTCPALSATAMPIVTGTLNLLCVAPDRVETWTMTYELVLERTVGERKEQILLKGVKYLHQQNGSSPWTDLTTLYVDIHAGAKGDGVLLGRGIVSLDLQDLLKQLSTFRMEPTHELAELISAKFPSIGTYAKLFYAKAFVAFFGTTVFRAYGGLFSDLKNFTAEDLKAQTVRELRCPDPKHYTVRLSDGFIIGLTNYRGGDKGPVVLAPGLSVKASSFATPTVDENLVEYLTDKGFDVWLFAYRASPDSGSPLARYSIDDIAEVDWPAAVEFILNKTGSKDLQVVAHCVGSMSLLMSLLKNKLRGVRSIVSSQLTLHPSTNWLNDLKSELGAVKFLEDMPELAGQFNFIPGETDLDREIDALAWMAPIAPAEACKNPVCRRIFTLIGPSYTHGQLNHATHTSIGNMFGAVHLSPFEQLSRIMAEGKVVDANGKDSYLSDQNARQFLSLPISFIAGARNQLFYPETSLRTFKWLSRVNGPGHYTRRLFPDYAHMDLFIGKNASEDIFPYIADELARYAASAVKPA